MIHKRKSRCAYGGSSTTEWDIVFVTEPGVGPNSRGLTAHRYIEEIIGEHMVPFACYIGHNFILMNDKIK